MVDRQVGHNLLQPRVLVLELLQPLHLRRKQPGILLLPIKVGCLADPGLPADLRNRRSIFALIDDERHLRVRENARLHPIPLLSQPGKRSRKLQLQSVKFPGIRSWSSGPYPLGLRPAQCAGSVGCPARYPSELRSPHPAEPIVLDRSCRSLRPERGR